MSHLTHVDIAKYYNFVASFKDKKGATRSDIAAYDNALIEEDPGLPRIYIIGDSISIGYTPYLRENFKDIANVLRVPMNCSSSQIGKENIDEWIDIGQVDLYLVNFGIHDILRDRRVRRENYLNNILGIMRMLAYKGRVAWVTSTPFTGDSKLHPLANEEAHKDYCKASKELMKASNIPVCDLDELDFTKEDYQKDGLHFDPSGLKKIADQITLVAKKCLGRKIYV